MNKKIIIGLVGQKSSGKDTVAAYLEEKYGFKHVSSGDIIREYVTKNQLGDPKVRDVLIKVGNQLRKERGGDVLVKVALEDDIEKLVISGLRAVTEIEAITAAGGEVWVVEAPIELRFEWAKLRGRIGENVSFEEFVEAEEKENINLDKNTQNIMLVVEMADKVILNNGTLADLEKKVDGLMV